MKMKLLISIILFFYSLFLFNNLFAKENKLNSLDQFIVQSMQKHQVPAVSIAVIENGKIIYAQAYSNKKNLVPTPGSLFQSASIGKSVTAYGVLTLVEKKSLNLDDNVNNYLKSWKVPDSTYTKKQPVTLRTILAMTSGLSVPGFIGHSVNSPMPSLGQILRGQAPAENKAVEVQFVPGSRYFYSGGGYEVVEQLIEDVTQNSFNDFMQKAVLRPLQMSQSQFKPVLPKNLWDEAVPGFLKDGQMIKGKWNIIPELGAGGLWTTPTDLAKFAIELIKAFNGHGKLSQNLAQDMLNREKNTDFGLGFVIDGCNKSLNFRKEGHNIGFYNWLIAFPHTKQGLVIMTNSENGMPLIKEVVEKTSKLFNWPKHYPIVDESESIPRGDCIRDKL